MIIIKNLSIVTQNPRRQIIKRGFLVIEGDKIKAIEEGGVSFCKKSALVLDGAGLVALPGFVNAHVHLGDSIFADLIQVTSLEEYLAKTDEITQKTDLIERGRPIVGEYAVRCFILNGTTTLAGGRIEPFCLGKMCGVSGYVVMDSWKLRHLLFDLKDNLKIFLKHCNDCSIKRAIFVHSLNKVNERCLEAVRRVLDFYPNTLLMIHVAETKLQRQEVIGVYGGTEIEILKKFGLLSPRTILIHANWLDYSELIESMRFGASFVHCLSSNLAVADKTLDIGLVLPYSRKLCVASDGIATGGKWNLLDEARCVWHYHRHVRGFNAQRALDMITVDAARALRLNNWVGSIEKDKRADIVLLKNHVSEFCSNVEDFFEDNSWQVNGVILGGRIIKWRGAELLPQQSELSLKYQSLVQQIREEIK